MAKSNYGNESIRSQTDLETMRNNANIFLGSDDLDGAFQTFKEILANSVDEANAGFGTEIDIYVYQDGSVSIEDFGRGLPMDYNKAENQYNWHLVFCQLHAGAKLKGSDSRSVYKSSVGVNGVGSAATQLSSEFCNVKVKRDNWIYEMHFKNGEPIKDLKKSREKDRPQKTGTFFHWKCSDEVFTEVDFKLDDIKSWVNYQAIVNAGLKFNLVDERHDYKETFYYENGILDYAKEQLPENKISDLIHFEASGKGRDTAKRLPYEVQAEVVFAFSDKSETLYFHNSIPLEYGGSPKRAMEDAFTEFFSSELKKIGKLKGQLKFDDVKENLLFISSTKTQVPPSFENQTKKAISNKFIQEFLTGQILLKLKEWSKENKLEFEKVRDQILINKESRTSAAAHRALKRQKLTKEVNGMKHRIDNFVDCRSKDVEKRELYIAEGNSAGGSIKQARNPDFQAVFPIRGKIKSVYKTSTADALSNREVKNIIQLIGTGVNSKTTKCNLDDIKFDKIVIATDFDVDGHHISALLLTLFYTFMPEVIEKGHVYLLQTPLYEIQYKDGTAAYAYSDNEKDDLTINKKVKNINRNKGLGEIDAAVMSRCLNPKTRHLIQYTMDDAKHAAKFIELFMGANALPRKEYIAAHMHEYDVLDIIE